MGNCEFCKKESPSNVNEYRLFFDHFKVCEKCVEYQHSRDAKGENRHTRCFAQDLTWCFFCHEPAEPGVRMFKRRICWNCVQKKHTFFSAKCPKVSVDWVDPNPLGEVPKKSPYVEREMHKRENNELERAVVRAQFAETIGNILGVDRRGKKKH